MRLCVKILNGKVFYFDFIFLNEFFFIFILYKKMKKKYVGVLFGIF